MAPRRSRSLLRRGGQVAGHRPRRRGQRIGGRRLRLDDLASRAAAQAAGSTASSSPWRAATAIDAVSHKVGLNYAAFSGAYSGGYADQLALVLLPACALSTPPLATCRARTPVRQQRRRGRHAHGRRARRARVRGTIHSARGGLDHVGFGGASPPPRSPRPGHGRQAGIPALRLQLPGHHAAVKRWVRAERGRSRTTRAAWTAHVGHQLSGLVARGRLGLHPGIIERSYRPVLAGRDHRLGRLCSDRNMSLSLGALSGAFMRDSGGAWKLQEDDGTQVIPLAGATTAHGRARRGRSARRTDLVLFRRDHLPGGNGSNAATGSAWTEPCLPDLARRPDVAGQVAVVQRHRVEEQLVVADMAVALEPGLRRRCARQPADHDLGSEDQLLRSRRRTRQRHQHRLRPSRYLRQIGYGSGSRTQPPARRRGPVTFDVAEHSNPGYANCDYSYVTSNLTTTAVTSNWPDVPADQICPTQSGACTNDTPTFFTTKLLSSITTTVRVGATAHTVDTYAFTQMFPSPQAGVVSSSVSADQGDGTVAVLWLASITRTGNDTLGGGSSAGTKPITFLAEMMQNRVDGNSTGSAALYRPRMNSITTEAGAQIAVSYYLGASQSCSRVNHVLPSSSDQGRVLLSYRSTGSRPTARVRSWTGSTSTRLPR